MQVSRRNSRTGLTIDHSQQETRITNVSLSVSISCPHPEHTHRARALGLMLPQTMRSKSYSEIDYFQAVAAARLIRMRHTIALALSVCLTIS